MAKSCGCTQSVHCEDFLVAMESAVADARHGLGVADTGHDEGDECACDMRRTCGPVAWGVLHSWAKAVNDQICGHCGEFAQGMATFMHDLVNAKLGKPLHDPYNFAVMCGKVYELQASASQGGALMDGLRDLIPMSQDQGPYVRRTIHGNAQGVSDATHSFHARAALECGGGQEAARPYTQPRRYGRECSSGAGACVHGAAERDRGHGQGRLQPHGSGARAGLAGFRQASGTAVLLDTNVLSVLTVPDHSLRPFYLDFLAGRERFVNLMAVAENLGAVDRLNAQQEREFRRVLDSMPRLALREDVAVFWAQLRTVARRGLSDNDLWMAAFAMSYDIPLVTDDASLAALAGTEIAGRRLQVFSRHLANLATAPMAQGLHGSSRVRRRYAASFLASDNPLRSWSLNPSTLSTPSLSIAKPEVIAPYRLPSASSSGHGRPRRERYSSRRSSSVMLPDRYESTVSASSLNMAQLRRVRKSPSTVRRAFNTSQTPHQNGGVRTELPASNFPLRLKARSAPMRQSVLGEFGGSVVNGAGFGVGAALAGMATAKLFGIGPGGEPVKRHSRGQGMTTAEMRGHFKVNMTIGRLALTADGAPDMDSPSAQVAFLVDTGASWMGLPLDVIERLGLPQTDTVDLLTAEGTVRRAVYSAALAYNHRVIPVSVVYAPEPLLGSIPLDMLRLKVNPVDRVLEPGPFRAMSAGARRAAMRQALDDNSPGGRRLRYDQRVTEPGGREPCPADSGMTLCAASRS